MAMAGTSSLSTPATLPSAPSTPPESLDGVIHVVVPLLRISFAFLITAVVATSKFGFTAVSYAFRLVLPVKRPDARSTPSASPFSVISYVFAPFFAFFGLLYDVFFGIPIAAIRYVVEAFLPLYVMLGVAVILGLVLGLVGKVMCWKLQGVVQSRVDEVLAKHGYGKRPVGPKTEEDDEEDEEDEYEVPPRRRMSFHRRWRSDSGSTTKLAPLKASKQPQRVKFQ